MKNYMIFVGMGLEITALIVGSVYLGAIFDKNWGTNGYFVAGLIVISLIGWVVRILLLLVKLQKQEESSKTSHEDPF
jgi:hypothetical protein